MHIFLVSATRADSGGQRNGNRDYQLLADFSITSRLPQPCVNLLQNLSVHSDASDILAALILYIFHECGFVAFDSVSNDVTSIEIPTYWGYSNVTQIPENYSVEAASWILRQQIQQPSVPTNSYTIYLKLLNFSEERLVLIIRKIVNGDAVCVSFCFRDQSESICLPVTEFVHIDATDNAIVRIQQSATDCLKNIETLVNKIKSKIVTPIRNAVMLSAGLRCPSLIGLPKEILWQLMRRLDVKNLQILSHTCTYMRNEVRIYLDENHINLAANRRSTPIVRLPPNYSYPRAHLFRFN